jgi:DNA repair protein RadC
MKPAAVQSRVKTEVAQAMTMIDDGRHHEPLVHNQADIQMTRAIVDIAQPLGIAAHDHIIVGTNGHASLNGMKLIYEGLGRA